jgi:phosphatidate cytidylyltransferase
MLLSNPLAHPFLAPLGWTLAGLFASSLVALLLTVHGHWQMLSASVLFQRWRTWLVIAPLFSLVVLSGPLAVAVFAAVVGVQAVREYARLTDLTRADSALLTTAAVTLPLAATVTGPVQAMPVLIALPLLASVPALLSQDVEHGARRATSLAFGLWYLPVALAALVLVERHPHGGPGLLLTLGLGVALSDVGAFTVGKLLRGPRLAPRVSPSKTWAGVLGNVVGATVGCVLLGGLAADVPFVLLVGVVSLGAVWGDLLESLLKRAAGAKDAGAWLPGFGGLLDRVDSLLVALPLTYVVLEVLP